MSKVYHYISTTYGDMIMSVSPLCRLQCKVHPLKWSILNIYDNNINEAAMHEATEILKNHTNDYGWNYGDYDTILTDKRRHTVILATIIKEE